MCVHNKERGNICSWLEICTWPENYIFMLTKPIPVLIFLLDRQKGFTFLSYKCDEMKNK